MTEERIRRLTSTIHALAQAQFDTPFVPQGAADALGDLERAMVELLAAMRKRDAESNSAINSLASANVRVLLWNEALQKVNAADNLLYHGGDITAFLHQIVGDAMEMTRARYGALGVFGDEGTFVRFVSLGVAAPSAVASGQASVDTGLLELIGHQETILRVPDVRAHLTSCGLSPGQMTIETLIGMPLRIGGKAKGALYLADKEGDELLGDRQEQSVATFGEDDEIMLALFGDYLTRALERMDLMQKLQESNGLLETERADLKRLIRELHAAQDQLLQSEKMASLGQLAAGVAHEINNPVGYVNSNLGTLKNYVEQLLGVIHAYEHCETEHAIRSDLLATAKQSADLAFLREDILVLLGESRDGLDRVKKIVQDLKDFSHVGDADWQEVDLHKGLDSTLNVVNNEIKYKAKVIKEYGELPPIECLPSQLNQVFMNLLVNAAHAIDEHGTITVRTGSDGHEVWVEVADTGSGIAPENMKRIFDPFFTTKPVGQGTGLGLSLSFGIVRKHDGRIEVKSTVGEGTTFRVWLPVKRPPTSGPVALESESVDPSL